MFRRLLALALAFGLAPLASAQSNAINGAIEGVTKDTSGAVLPGVTVNVTNLDTGAARSLTTNSATA